jgi:hypothetical protein
VILIAKFKKCGRLIFQDDESRIDHGLMQIFHDNEHDNGHDNEHDGEYVRACKKRQKQSLPRDAGEGVVIIALTADTS